MIVALKRGHRLKNLHRLSYLDSSLVLFLEVPKVLKQWLSQEPSSCSLQEHGKAPNELLCELYFVESSYYFHRLGQNLRRIKEINHCRVIMRMRK